MKELVTYHEVYGQTFELCPEKALYWKEKNALIVADLHIGKAGHFRKSGIPVSDLVHSKDMLVLDRLIARTSADHVIFLGDLFHSEHNVAWPNFKRWVESKYPLTFTLVLGNHDILPQQEYVIKNMDVVEELIIDPFHFTHIPEKSDHFNIAGHIHPAVRLQGKGRQSMRIPCFYFNKTSALIPAFGSFTGTANLKVKKEDFVFAVAEDQVMRVN